ncbi:lipoprotein, putative [Oceanicola granulosus HTCC2516]|uniref:Lipoprotein, putative n=1 Tax=Oceanicola granulosus (strain ATCC BAA-861 / DSM 15982 / KCTC 12143 / HTCC2516) TaxID=314256 RepID=Q2CID7_OCEGH|nr:tetratricopeptide repeat protein [Oceanicola granulosus]EAR52321.1 lipoprotein, putative [Oceanicola granulosus HTCC2516]
MRHSLVTSMLLAGALAASGCAKPDGEAEVNRALQDLNVVDDANLNDVMLTVADPNEAVAYFTRAVATAPERLDLRRGLATSLVRAGRAPEAVEAWTLVTASPGATNEDRVEHADALIRANRWDEAEAVLDSIPPTHETYSRYKLEAMIADSNEQWSNADSFYETASGLTTTPASVLNNWGYSKLTRGDYPGAERLFAEAIRHEPSLFTAKNNLMLARGAQRNYDLPVVPMSQTERAQLLHTLALAAIKQSDISIGRSLLREAIDTHPQHFEAAARSLAALEENVAN